MKSLIRRWLLRRKFPAAIFDTTDVAGSARLGKYVHLATGVRVGPDVVIGDYSYVNTYTEIASGSIGRFSSIASFCSIGLNAHPLDWISTSPMLYSKLGLAPEAGYRDNRPAPVIMNDVWIGTHAVILRGVKVGDGAVVGAGAVVTRDVPPYAIVTGVPAVVRRYRFPQEVVQRLLALEWWRDDVSLSRLSPIRRYAAPDFAKYIP